MQGWIPNEFKKTSEEKNFDSKKLTLTNKKRHCIQMCNRLSRSMTVTAKGVQKAYTVKKSFFLENTKFLRAL